MVTSPLIQDIYDAKTDSTRKDVTSFIAERLHIPDHRVLDTPACMPYALFSTSTHLNRWGRDLFTEELAVVVKDDTP